MRSPLHPAACALAPLALFLAICLAACAPTEKLAEVTVYKTPTCGCCGKWVTHLESAGFSVEVHDLPDLTQLKATHGVPKELSACHTALVEGYVVEGHVPADDVVRLLEQRPSVSGLAVPGMPIGSPGMEGPNPEAYQVLSFDPAGRTRVFATHGP